MSLRVHMIHSYDADALDHLRRHLDPAITLTVDPGVPEPADYQILVAGRPRREHITASPNLQTLIIPWAGLPDTTRDLMLEFPQIAIHNLHHNAGAVAEMVITLMLAAAKFILPADRGLRDHDWTFRYQPSPALQLEGQTALILGYGAIGQRVARMCRGLGIKVLAIRRSVSKASDDVAQVYPPEALERLLPQANLLLICLPHTPETDGLIDKAALALLPPDAVLVNVGRAKVVEEAALFHALQDGSLYAAGLDVWYNYPTDEESRSCTPPSAFPFHELENVVMSPHRAGVFRDIQPLRMAHLADILNAAVRGEEMPNRVDLQGGY